jgi:hypothetical protein
MDVNEHVRLSNLQVDTTEHRQGYICRFIYQS